MDNFAYENPTRILFGRAMECKVGEEARKYGGKVLLHYGMGSIKRSGLYDRIVQSLVESGMRYVELPGVQPNPHLGKVREGIEICRREGVDLILAVGGGSVVDSAKAIGFGAKHDGDVWSFFTAQQVVKETLPVGVVLTLPGTGSESSLSCVITKEEGLIKRAVNTDVIRPKFAILNPELTFTLPPYQSSCGIWDAMTHVMERYFTNSEHVEIGDRMCEAVLRVLIEFGAKVLTDPEDYDARAQAMWASKVAHDGSLGVGRVGDFASHAIAHEISAMFNVAHGATLSIVFPAWMRHVYKNNVTRFVRFAMKVWDVEYHIEDQERTVLEGLQRMESFCRNMGLPVRLGEIDVDANRLEEMAEKCAGSGMVGHMVGLNREDVLEILRRAQ